MAHNVHGSDAQGECAILANERPSRFIRGGNLLVTQGAEIVVILESFLNPKELFVREDDKLLFSVFFNDLRMNAHIGSTVCFFSVEDTIHDHSIACDLEKRPPIASPHAKLREMVAELLHVPAQAIFEPVQSRHHAFALRRGNPLQVPLSFRLKLDAIGHRLNACLSERPGSVTPRQ
jgi:hypothetical protein